MLKGGPPQWNKPIWQLDLPTGLRISRLGIETHLVTSHYLLPLLVAQPGGLGDRSGGEREFAPVLARAAVAVGVAAIFIETHRDPEHATGAEGPTMVPLRALTGLLENLIALDKLSKARPVQLER